jgi:hypothetical protein
MLELRTALAPNADKFRKAGEMTLDRSRPLMIRRAGSRAAAQQCLQATHRTPAKPSRSARAKYDYVARRR